jgi:hypothetical protein
MYTFNPGVVSFGNSLAISILCWSTLVAYVFPKTNSSMVTVMLAAVQTEVGIEKTPVVLLVALWWLMHRSLPAATAGLGATLS